MKLGKLMAKASAEKDCQPHTTDLYLKRSSLIKIKIKNVYIVIGSILGHLCETEGRSVANIYSTFL